MATDGFVFLWIALVKIESQPSTGEFKRGKETSWLILRKQSRTGLWVSECAAALKTLTPEGTSHQRLNRHPQPSQPLAVIQVRFNPKARCTKNKLEQRKLVLKPLVYSV